MSEMVNRAVEALKRLPVRDREAPGSELDELRLREAVRAVITAMREPAPEIREQVKQAIWKNTWGDVALDEHWRNMIDASLT